MSDAILVTGGAGYVGSHTVLALQEAGYSVVVVDNLSTGARDALPGTVDLVVGNAGDCNLMAQVFASRRISAVMHFAASTVVPESVAEPLEYYQNNTVNSLNLLKSTLEAGVDKFIFSSTAAVYGEPAQLPVEETAPAVPINPYGRSKLMTETMLQDAAAAHGVQYAILRYFNVAGADPELRSGQSSPNATHLIKVASQVAVEARAELTVFGNDYPTADGTCIRDYIHVSDLADAHLLALKRLEQRDGTLLLNVGYGKGYSVHEVVSAVERVAGTALPVRQGARRAGDTPAIYASSGRIRRELGWTPRYADLDFIASTALAWERRLRGLSRDAGRGGQSGRPG